MLNRFDVDRRQIVLHAEGEICENKAALLHSPIFGRFVALYCESLQEHRSPLIEPFTRGGVTAHDGERSSTCSETWLKNPSPSWPSVFRNGHGLHSLNTVPISTHS